MINSSAGVPKVASASASSAGGRGRGARLWEGPPPLCRGSSPENAWPGSGRRACQGRASRACSLASSVCKGLEVAQEMLLQTGGVVFGMVAQQPQEAVAKARLLEHRPEGNVQYLPRVELLQQGGKLFIWHILGLDRPLQTCRDVVARPVLLVAFAGEIVDLTEQVWVEDGNGAQCLQVARARRLEVGESPGLTDERWVDGELVRTRVQAQLVRPVRRDGAGDGGVDLDVLLEARYVAHVVYALLEASDVARGQAHPPDPKTPQLRGDVDVLGVSRRALCLVHGDLDLEVALPHRRPEVAIETRHVGHGGTVLDGRLRQGEVVEADFVPISHECPVEVAPLHVGRNVLEILPRQILQCCAKRRGTGGFSPVIDVLSGIEREEAVPRGDTGIYIFSGLEMVGVRSEALLPAFGEDAPGCVVENLLGASVTTIHLSYGLLGEDGRESSSRGAQGPDVARGGEPQPVAETS